MSGLFTIRPWLDTITICINSSIFKAQYTHANQLQTDLKPNAHMVDGTAHMRCTICKWFAYRLLWTKICWFLVWTQRDLDALAVLCLPQVHRKLIERWNRTLIDSPRIAKNRWIPNIHNILGRSRINWWVITRTDFHIRIRQYSSFPKIWKCRECIRRIMTNTENVWIHRSAHYLFDYSCPITCLAQTVLKQFCSHVCTSLNVMFSSTWHGRAFY